MQLLDVDSPKVKGMLSNPAFLCRMRQPVKMIFDKNVPFLVGNSKDAKRLYIDRNIKRFWHYKNKSIDIYKFVILVGKGRKALIDLFGLDYANALYIAVWGLKYPALVKDGIKIEDYINHITPQMKLPVDVKQIPSDLDLTTYSEDDIKILKKKLEKKGRNVKTIRKRGLSQLQKGQANPRQQGRGLPRDNGGT